MHSSGSSVYEADVLSFWCLSLLLSDRGGRLHGLCFSLCRSSLKPNTGTRSHLPGMAQMPSTIPVPCSHKTEVEQEVVIQGGAIAPGLWCLHNFRTCWRTSDWERTSRHMIIFICLISVGATLLGGPWPSINLGDLPQALCSLSYSHSEDSVSVEPCSGFPLYA